QSPEELQEAAIQALSTLRQAQGADLLLRGWKSYSPALRRSVLDTKFQTDEGTRSILDSLESGRLLPFEIDAVCRQKLLQHRSRQFRERAARLLAGSIDSDRQKVVDARRDVLAAKGDALQGAQVFRRVCATCHQLGGVGNAVGPDLASLGD